MLENRQDNRLPTALQVTYRCTTVDEFVQQYGHHVSARGIFVRTKESLALGTLVRFQFRLTHGAPIVEGMGTVVWRRVQEQADTGPAGMGIRFMTLHSESQLTIERVVADRGGAPSQFEQLKGAEIAEDLDSAATSLVVAGRERGAAQPTVQAAPPFEVSGARPAADRPARPPASTTSRHSIPPPGPSNGHRVRMPTPLPSLPPGVASAGPALPNVAAPISAKTFVNAARKQRAASAANMAGLFSGATPERPAETASPIASFFPPAPTEGASVSGGGPPGPPAASVVGGVSPVVPARRSAPAGHTTTGERRVSSVPPAPRAVAPRRRVTTTPPVTPPPLGLTTLAGQVPPPPEPPVPPPAQGAPADRDQAEGSSPFTLSMAPLIPGGAPPVGADTGRHGPVPEQGLLDAERGALAELFADLGEEGREQDSPAAAPLDPTLSDDMEDAPAHQQRVRRRSGSHRRMESDGPATGSVASAGNVPVPPPPAAGGAPAAGSAPAVHDRPPSLEPAGPARSREWPPESLRGLYFVLLWCAVLGVPLIAFLAVRDGMDGQEGVDDLDEAVLQAPPMAALPPEPETAPPDPTPVSARLVIETTPPEAEVWLGEEPAGPTPLTVELPIGKETILKIKKHGYEALSHAIVPEEEEPAPVRLELQSLPYVLRVESVPPGAEVTFMGQRLVTPGEFRVRSFRGRETLVFRRLGFKEAVRTVRPEYFEEREGRMIATSRLRLTPSGREAFRGAFPPAPSAAPPPVQAPVPRGDRGRQTAPASDVRRSDRPELPLTIRGEGDNLRVAPAPPTPPPEVPVVDPALSDPQQLPSRRPLSRPLPRE